MESNNLKNGSKKGLPQMQTTTQVIPGQDMSSLSKYILRSIILERRPYESYTHLAVRRTCQIVAATIASAARLAFAAPSYEAGDSDHGLGILLAYGNVVAYSVIFIWCTLNLLQHLMAPVHPEEKAINFVVSSKCIQVPLVVLSFIFGFFAQFPIAYLAYTYNHDNWLVAIAVMVSDIWFPVYSTWCGLSKLLVQRRYSLLERQAAKVKQCHISWLLNCQTRLVAASAYETETLSDALCDVRKRLCGLENTLHLFGHYTWQMNELNETQLKAPAGNSTTCWTVGQLMEKVVFAISFIFLISRYALTIRVGFEGWRLLWDQLVFDICMTVIVFLSFLYLLGVSIPNAAVRLFKLLTGLACCNYQPTLAQKSMPISSILLTMVALFTTSFSWGPAKEFSTDYFQGWAQVTMLATSPAATFLLTTNIALLAVDQILQELVLLWGSPSAKIAMELNLKYDDYVHILQVCSVKEYMHFLQEFPKEYIQCISPNAASLVEVLNGPGPYSNDQSHLLDL